MREEESSSEEPSGEAPAEIAFVGDLTENQGQLSDKLLEVPHQGDCVLYFDSPGGSPYCAISYMTIILLRQLRATGIVTGECSSAALWPFAACQRRFVTPHSVLLFHPLKSQSDESIGLAEAAEWSRHFSELEKDMDVVLARLLKTDVDRIAKWMNPGRYVSGNEFAEAGLATLVDLTDLPAAADEIYGPCSDQENRPTENRPN